MKAKKKTERPFRIDFNTNSRKIIEVYEVSPDGSKIKTKRGWVASGRSGVITQRPPHEPGFMTADQIDAAIQAEKEMLREKKYKDTAAYAVAVRYPIGAWLRRE